MNLLDIGGGFSAHRFNAMASSIRQSIGRYFCGVNVEVVAEPGRYFVAGALTLACGIIGRRDAAENDEDKESRHMIYLNDGVYGTFLCNIFEPGPQPKVLRASGEFYPLHSEDEYEKYTIWGPTCDGTDCVAQSVALPKSLVIGDWLYFPDMGGEFLPRGLTLSMFYVVVHGLMYHAQAYSTCLSTSFNGFQCDREIVYMSRDPAADICLRQSGI
jgi:ornithine decarboxylase